MLHNITGSLIHIEQTKLTVPGKIQDNAPCPGEVLVNQRAFCRQLDRIYSTALTDANAQECITALTLPENGRNIGKVHIDDPGGENQFCHTVNCLFENIVRTFKSLHQGHAPIFRQLGQIVVFHGNQRIHLGLHLGNAILRQFFLAIAFKSKGYRHYTYGQYAHFLGQTSQQRSCTCAGAAAHTGGNEHHIRTV